MDHRAARRGTAGVRLRLRRRYFGGKLSIDVQHELRQKVFAALQRLDGAKQDDLQTGQVVSRSISDLNLVQGLLGMLPMQIGNVLTFVMSVILMFTLSPLLTVVALLIGPILWFVAIRGRRLLFPANWDAQQRVGEVAGVVEAAVTGVRVVKGFGQEDQELDRLDRTARGLFTSRMRTVRLNSFYNPIMQVLPALGSGRRPRARRLPGAARARSRWGPSSPSPPTWRPWSGRSGCCRACSPSASRPRQACCGCSR